MSEREDRRMLQDEGVIVARVACKSASSTSSTSVVQVRLRDDFKHFEWVPAGFDRGELLRLPLEVAAELGRQLMEAAEAARE